jgi:hypothetical protein
MVEQEEEDPHRKSFWHGMNFVQRTAVEIVVDPGTEISLAEAREMAGDEVELGDVLVLPIAEKEPTN